MIWVIVSSSLVHDDCISFSIFSSVQFSLVAQLCPTLCDTMDCSMPGIPVHHQLPGFTQTYVHQVGDAIQPSHPLLSPSPPAFNLSEHQGLFQWVSSSHLVAKILGVSASASVFPMNIQDQFPIGWIGWISLMSKWLSRVFSNIQHHSSKASILHCSAFFSPTLTSIHNSWKNHSLDLMDLCWQSNVCAF